MNHVHHIQKNKIQLEFRFEMLKHVREFFWSQGFLEVETPNLLKCPGQEPYLSPMKVYIHDEKKKEYTAYLHTSPEYTMKKMLAAGFEKIFSLGKVYRDYESFGGTHNPEFTMIEWYRSQADMWTLMDDMESLFRFILERLQEQEIIQNQESRIKNQGRNFQTTILNSSFMIRRVHMRDLWHEYVGVSLDEYLDQKSMYQLCRDRGYRVEDNESYEDLFYRIFLNEIEPKLTAPTFVHHYPALMAALAKISDTEPGYAERVEAYVGGLELANGFTELTDADEQLQRLQKEQELRRNSGKPVFDIDMEFIGALRRMPPSTGIALGIDRLVQVFLGCQNIDDVLVLPMSKVFENHE